MRVIVFLLTKCLKSVIRLVLTVEILNYCVSLILSTPVVCVYSCGGRSVGRSRTGSHREVWLIPGPEGGEGGSGILVVKLVC